MPSQKVAETLQVTVADLVLGDSDRERLFDAARALRAGDVHELLAAAKARILKP
jgi:hypothetical protein